MICRRGQASQLHLRKVLTAEHLRLASHTDILSPSTALHMQLQIQSTYTFRGMDKNEKRCRIVRPKHRVNTPHVDFFLIREILHYALFHVSVTSRVKRVDANWPVFNEYGNARCYSLVLLPTVRLTPLVTIAWCMKTLLHGFSLPLQPQSSNTSTKDIAASISTARLW